MPWCSIDCFDFGLVLQFRHHIHKSINDAFDKCRISSYIDKQLFCDLYAPYFFKFRSFDTNLAATRFIPKTLTKMYLSAISLMLTYWRFSKIISLTFVMLLSKWIDNSQVATCILSHDLIIILDKVTSPNLLQHFQWFRSSSTGDRKRVF